jgi:p-methyltransferase
VEPSPLIDLVQFIRSRNSETKIVVGGPYIFNLCRDMDVATQDYVLASIGADIYVRDSQGEATLGSILDRLRSRRDLDDVPNLIFLRHQTSAAAVSRPGLRMLDDVPQSAYAEHRASRKTTT